MTLLEYDLGSFFSLSTTLRSSVTHEEAERAIERELLRAWSMAFDAVLPEEKQMAIIVELTRLKSPLRRALRHLEWLRWRGRPFDIDRRIAEFRAVTADDVRRSRPAAREALESAKRHYLGLVATELTSTSELA